MFRELLVIGLVLLAAIVYVRLKARLAPTRPTQPPPTQAATTRSNRLAIWIAALLVGITLGVSGLLYYLNWRAAHQLFIVEVTNSHSGEVQQFQVYRDDIQGRRFRTTDGRQIHLSDAERMEVRPVAQAGP